MFPPSAQCLLLQVLVVGVYGAKQRSWQGPTQFTQGTSPSPRNHHGLTALNGTLIVFGGYGGGIGDLVQYSLRKEILSI